MTIRTVYLAGPYSDEPISNVKAALIVAEQVVRIGLYPFIPHLFHYWNEMFEHDYRFWMDQDATWIRLCDAVLMYNESPGALEDVQVARRWGIPVFYNIGDLATAVLHKGRVS